MLEVRTAISPTPAFFHAVRIIAASVREFYPDAVMHVKIGADSWPRDVAKILPWEDDGSIEWSWVPRDEFNRWRGTRYPYIATATNRFRPPFKGDHILSLDADVICIRRFDELFSMRGISGMMTHVAPMPNHGWRQLFAGFGLGEPREWHQHSAHGIMQNRDDCRVSPPYFNSGMVFGPREHMENLWAPYQDALDYLPSVMADTYWFDQIGLALAMAKADVQTNALPMRYNFANQQSFEQAFPAELADIRFLHFMREDVLHRQRDFADEGAIRRLTERKDLAGTNELLRQRIASLLAPA